jgi:hypothetical protein
VRAGGIERVGGGGRRGRGLGGPSESNWRLVKAEAERQAAIVPGKMYTRIKIRPKAKAD